MKYHLITFATESHISYANELIKTAKYLGGFDIVKIFTLEDIDEIFLKKNSNILSHKKGAGYWIWKSYIILKYLYENDKNDYICYCDSMYLFTGETKIQNIMENIKHKPEIFITNNKPNEPSYIEKQYSKGDAFHLMNAYDIKYSDSPQVWGGFIIIKNNFTSLQVISEWMTYVQDERIVTDDSSKFNENFSTFIENRHDQTVISIIIKKYNIPIFDFPKNFLHNIRVPL